MLPGHLGIRYIAVHVKQQIYKVGVIRLNAGVPN